MRLEETLNKISNIKIQGAGYTGSCPGHQDNHNSLSITEGADGRILLHCHAGCSTEKIVESMNLTMSDLYPDKEQVQERKKVAEYVYKDESGTIIHKTIRYEPKGFTQCRPDGKGGWIYNLTGINPIIYNLKKVKEAITRNENIYVVEGEKDCENMGKLGLAATTSPMGSGKWHDYYSDYLLGAHIVIIPDNDAPGKAHAEQVVKSLQGKARDVKILNLKMELPTLPEKGDITDFFLMLGKNKGLEALERLVNNAKEWQVQEVLAYEESWEAPILFDNYKLSAFPVDCFPDWLREYIEAVAEDTQTPADMAAVVGLGILSIPCAKVYKVEGKPGWREPLNLYCTSIARPGERKSAILAHMSNPIYKYESEKNEQLRSEIARSQTERKILEGEIAKLQAIASKDNTFQNRSAAMDKVEELSQFMEVRQLRIICDDVSPEKLVGLLANQNGRMAIVSAEGGIFDIMNGRYSQSINIDIFLKSHAGDPLRVDRITRDSEYIDDPALSMVLMIQPEVLTGIMQNESFRGRGLTARFLYSIPVSKVGARNIESSPIPEGVSNVYSRNLKNLLDVQIPDEPYILKLSPDAYGVSIEFAKRLEPRLIGDLENIADWSGKLHGAILRIAGILHIAEYLSQSPWEYAIHERTMQNAIYIGEYFIEHAKAVFAMMGADKNIEDAKYVLRWTNKQSQPELKKRDILRGNRRFKKVQELEPALKILCEYGYLKEFEQIKEKVGRNPDKIFKVNPFYLQQVARTNVTEVTGNIM